jgi:hypothetical protein
MRWDGDTCSLSYSRDINYLACIYSEQQIFTRQTRKRRNRNVKEKLEEKRAIQIVTTDLIWSRVLLTM